jgi:methylphosphotriester-DNA--protein-cysteine methyltransferase
MAYNYHIVFAELEQQLSRKPNTHLYEITRQLGCSRPIIEKAVLRHTSLTFRDYQKAKRLERVDLLIKQGCTVKEIALDLGYKWPENYSRFIRRSGVRKAGATLADNQNSKFA